MLLKIYKKMDSNGVIWWSTDQSTWKREAERVGAAPSTHSSQHATGGSDPITPESIRAMPKKDYTAIIDGLLSENTNGRISDEGWYRILKAEKNYYRALLINISHTYTDSNGGPENMLVYVCLGRYDPSIVILTHCADKVVFYTKLRITFDSDYLYIDFYRANNGIVCIPKVSIISFTNYKEENKTTPLAILPVDEAPAGETILLMQDVSVIPSGNVLTDANKAKSVAVTLTASGWNSSSKTQTVTVSGVLADETKQLITPTPAIASQEAYYNAGIRCTGQAANSLTFTAKTIPTADLTVYVTIQEVGA